MVPLIEVVLHLARIKPFWFETATPGLMGSNNTVPQTDE